MEEIKVDKQKLHNLHDEFKNVMIEKYKFQYSEKETIEIFDFPETFLSWCIRNGKVTLTE